MTRRPGPPDLVKRDFTADRPNALWVTDLTMFRRGRDGLRVLHRRRRRTGHARLGALVQHDTASRLARRHPASRVRGRLLRSTRPNGLNGNQTTESPTDPGRFRPRTFAVTDPGVPLCLSSGDFAGFELTRCASFVGDHESPEVGGESSLQAAECPVSGLAFGEFRVEVVPTLSRIRTWVTATRWVRPRSPRCRTHSCPRSPAARILVVPPSAIRRDAVCSSLSHRGLIGSSVHRPTLHR